MGFQYYQRHEWWRDDNRTYRPRKKARERDYFYKVANEHGFDANPSHFGFSRFYIASRGINLNDWMLCLNPREMTFYDDQQVMLESSYWWDSQFYLCQYKEISSNDFNFNKIYVLKSDYDWAIQERDCDIEDLI